ncbi:phage minor head protein [Undibacterium sp.]|uniref:phage minor head protein n=1 Tax=Undibacterium sp. TaxID=1914977 RepID=UPI00272F20EA|nr:phage minor head protein [Undibacterium sp.]MDP1980485.1 phage minor head protein [Undibacterium sp.]
MAAYERLPPWNKPFAEQLAFFKYKLSVPTERWNDILREAHDRAFMVAGAQSADLLNDLNAAITKAIENGTGIEAFRKDFKQIVAKNGWTGWTGEESAAKTAWRTKVIYQTNMSTSYAAGRWKQLNDPELQKVMPYWQYKHNDGVIYPRPLHKSWDGLTLPSDHPFWKQHFPPNGWGCQCRVVPVTKAKFMKAVVNGRGPANAPDQENTEGIDDGFAYAPGANMDTSFRSIIQDKLITYPPAISKALSRLMNKTVHAEDVVDFVNDALANPQLTENQFLGFVENAEAIQKAIGEDTTGFIVLLKSEYARHVNKSHARDGGQQRPPKPADFAHVITVLNEADKLMPGDESNHGLPTIKASKTILGDLFTAVFEVRLGKKNRVLNLLSMYIKV